MYSTVQYSINQSAIVNQIEPKTVHIPSDSAVTGKQGVRVIRRLMNSQWFNEWATSETMAIKVATVESDPMRLMS